MFEDLAGSLKLNKSVGNNGKKMNTMPYIDNEMKDIIEGGKSVSSKSHLKKYLFNIYCKWLCIT